MSITNVHESWARAGLSTTASCSNTVVRSSPQEAAALSPLQFSVPKLFVSSFKCSTSQGLSEANCSPSNRVSFRCAHDEKGVWRTLSSRHFGALKHPNLTKSVSSRRSPISSAAGEETAGRVEGDSASNCLYLKRTIRNGEVVEHSGTVIILGDVEPGGHVLADGDVIVLGRLQGHVHAGRAGGAFTSRIFATNMDSGGLQICDSVAFFPDINDQTPVSKMAVLSKDGSIRVFPAAEEAAERRTAPVNFKGMPRKWQTRQIRDFKKNRPAQVALFTGIYISVAGIALLGFPKFLFGILFDLQGVSLGWARVAATLAVVFGVYYIGTAVGDVRGVDGAKAFYLSTVVGRTFLFLSFSWLVLMRSVPAPLLLVGIVNLVGAMLMLKALRSPAESSGS